MLKLDFEKAYDMLKWDCMLEALHSWGFPPTWISWVALWLLSAKVKILVNGTQEKEISYKRGLRQGDPISSLIFLLVTGGLHHMIAIGRAEGLLKGFGCRDDMSAIVNLQYADVTFIFGKESVPQVMVLKWVLLCYEK